MTTVARRIRATPERSAVETWTFIVKLISTSGSAARRELEAVTGVGACIIADEVPKQAPIVVAGSGPRVRLYCLYGEDAITGDDSNEADLASNPTDGDWTMWLPTSSEDIKWVAAELAKHGKRIVGYDLLEEKPGDSSKEEDRSELKINVEEYKKP